MENKLAVKQELTHLLINTTDNKEVIKYTSKLTVETAQKGEQLSKINRIHGEGITLKILSRVITNLNDSINIGNKLNNDQIFEIAVTILNEYWRLKIDEVLNCFNMAKNGRFGKVYGLDQPTIMGWLLEYDTKLKGDYYESQTTTHTNRTRDEENKPKHIALTVNEINKLNQ